MNGRKADKMNNVEQVYAQWGAFNELCGSIQADKSKNITDIFKTKVDWRAKSLLSAIHEKKLSLLCMKNMRVSL